MAETLYFDTCAINRLSDSDSDPRVRMESSAVISLLDLVSEGKILWTASIALRVELEQNPDLIARSNALALLAAATTFVFPTRSTVRRAAEI